MLYERHDILNHLHTIFVQQLFHDNHEENTHNTGHFVRGTATHVRGTVRFSRKGPIVRMLFEKYISRVNICFHSINI